MLFTNLKCNKSCGELIRDGKNYLPPGNLWDGKVESIPEIASKEETLPFKELQQ